MDDCFFCRIIAGKIPAKLVYEDESVLAFEDIHPQAPTHVLVVPRKHLHSLLESSRRMRRFSATSRLWPAAGARAWTRYQRLSNRD